MKKTGDCPLLPFFDRRLRKEYESQGDKETDTLYFRLDEESIVESEEVRPGVILDYDKNGRVVGVEFLSVSQRASQAELAQIQFQAL
jgi:uncharacterized protein YuzE